MNINANREKIFVTIPLEKVSDVKKSMYKVEVEIIRNYTYCAPSTKLIDTIEAVKVNEY